MPRLSADERAGAAFRAGIAHPTPPKDMPAEAKKLFREIVECRPADFFGPGSLELLATFCRLSIVQRGLVAAAEADPDAVGKAQKLGVFLNVTAAKLRLTVQSASRVGEGKLDEKRPRAPSGLLGGNVAELRRA